MSGWYWLNYKGPDVPWQKLRSAHDPVFERVLNDNTGLKRMMQGYDLPQKRIKAIAVDGIELNTAEIVPPDFDPNAQQRYGVLFRVYGGPDSQQVSTAFNYDFSQAIVSDPEQDMIVVVVDGRGTGAKGQKFTCVIRKQLGMYEVIDIVNTAKYWSQLPYIDPKRIAIQGWSYGGYLAAKVIEANSGFVQAGVSCAPVTDWRFYDTIYTERYMLTPQENESGYNKSSVNNMEGFKNAHYLLMHGSGDDNVHFQHTLDLLDKFTGAQVRGYKLRVFTDSDHGMSFHGATKEVWTTMKDFLLDVIPASWRNNGTRLTKRGEEMEDVLPISGLIRLGAINP